ncbi:MAG TPA: glutamine--fructose-6-phosphate transaminase (isomerizing) [Spirochaetota bacterium]|nr:glutamine--fructose-6-phosphate transaminase (isomerizing) [Spirochaetota bacterium]HPU87580.1 glutamine--fructose-6-phosphate transaminase (isomerizing) [Spirochaetota bacterium]
MCGIVGYVGNESALDVILSGLKRLEYRGYDSSGVALVNGNMFIEKRVGKISNLEDHLAGKNLGGFHVGIGHTRWATHGVPSDINAHPHTGCHERIAIVHNGIIENYAAIKKMLIDKGHIFSSETDSEVIAHLIEYYIENNSFLDAVLKALAKLEGTYGILAISESEPDTIIAARKGSPLLLGIADDAMILASDASAIIEYTRKVVYLEDGEIIEVKKDKMKTFDLERRRIDKKVEDITWDISDIEKQGFEHFMLKEIFEQPETIQNAYRGRIVIDEGLVRLDGITLSRQDINDVRRVILIACGTSFHAALVGEYLIEEFARIPVEVEYASEFRYRRPILLRGDLIVVISQSGETADTLAALREARDRGANVVGITNVVGSTIARECNAGGVYLHAGPEIGVASTKAFTSQIVVLYLLGIFLARRKGMTADEAGALLRELTKIPDKVQWILDRADAVKEVAELYKDTANCLYLGRGINFPVALEGALKLKEISYVHAEGYPAAEMKHGPIALIDENMPAVFAAPFWDEVYAKVVHNMQEVKARSGKIICIATEGDQEILKHADHVLRIPNIGKMLSPLLSVIPLQLLSYYVAVLRGCNVDQPRNLAKSVTVE